MNTYEQIEVGQELPPLTMVVSRLDLIRYCGVSGDFNTIHWDERTARQVGLPNVIAHGMFTMAVAIRVVTDWLEDPGAVLDYSVRFTRPVVVADSGGAELTVVGKVRSKGEDGLIDLELTATVDGQTVLARSRVTARVRSN